MANLMNKLSWDIMLAAACSGVFFIGFSVPCLISKRAVGIVLGLTWLAVLLLAAFGRVRLGRNV